MTSRWLFSSSASRGRLAKGNVRPCLFFVLPGASRTSPALKSTLFHWSSKTSDFLHPVTEVN